MSFENLFSLSGREESVGLILAECCGSIGFPLTREAGQDADFLANYCSIDDISGKPSVKLKVLILYPNREVIVPKLFNNATKSLITNLVLNWKTAVGNTAK